MCGTLQQDIPLKNNFPKHLKYIHNFFWFFTGHSLHATLISVAVLSKTRVAFACGALQRDSPTAESVRDPPCVNSSGKMSPYDPMTSQRLTDARHIYYKIYLFMSIIYLHILIFLDFGKPKQEWTCKLKDYEIIWFSNYYTWQPCQWFASVGPSSNQKIFSWDFNVAHAGGAKQSINNISFAKTPCGICGRSKLFLARAVCIFEVIAKSTITINYNAK